MEAEIIHAVGVCVDVKERERALSSTPQACGVLSYYPRRRRVGVWDFVSLGEAATRLGGAVDPMAQILEVRLFDAQLQQFFDDCREVCQGTNRAQRRRSGSTQDPARRGEHQCVFDGSQRHAALLQSGSQETVRLADGARGSRRLAVGAEHLLDIFFPADGLLFHGIHLSLAGPATTDRRWSLCGSSAARGSAAPPPSVCCPESCATRHTPSWWLL